MNAELDRLRKEMTREEFIQMASQEVIYHKKIALCPENKYEIVEHCQINCEQCYREAVKYIQFKDDIEQTDTVNHPSHYTAGKYEVIDIIESIVNSMELTPYQGYLLGNIIKYIARFKHKGGAEDLKKANVYLEKLTKAVGE